MLGSILLAWNLKKLLYCDILHQHPQIFPKKIFRPKLKIIKFGAKMA